MHPAVNSCNLQARPPAGVRWQAGRGVLTTVHHILCAGISLRVVTFSRGGGWSTVPLGSLS
jgi:hypothetical protein